MYTYQVDGMEASAISRHGIWHCACSLELYHRRDEIRKWVQENYTAVGAVECLDFLDQGRIFFIREQDMAFFLLRWA